MKRRSSTSPSTTSSRTPWGRRRNELVPGAPRPFESSCRIPEIECEPTQAPVDGPPAPVSRLQAPIGGYWWLSESDFPDDCGADLLTLSLHETNFAAQDLAKDVDVIDVGYA